MKGKSLFIEGGPLLEEAGLILEDAVVTTPCDGVTYVTIMNMSGLTQKLSEESVVGEAQAAEVVTPEDGASGPVIRRLSSSQDEERRKKLLERIQLQGVPDADAGQLRTFLANNHSVFSLQDGEGGGTSLVTMPIDTGCTSPEAGAMSDATHLREKLMHESHRGVFSGHSAGTKLYKALSQRW